MVTGCLAACALLPGPGIASADSTEPAGAGAEAEAAAGAEAAITWSVVPADGSGPDQRTTIAHELDPGEQIRDRIAVRNLSDREVAFDLGAADGFSTAEGRFDMLPTGQPSVDAGTWIELPGSVTVAAGETEVVPFTLTVPDAAEPGDHAAGVAASVQLEPTRTAHGAEMGVESRVGVQVLARVTGEVAPAATIRHAELDYHGSSSPLRPGTASAAVVVENTGNTQLALAGQVLLDGRSVPLDSRQVRPQALLPGEQRTLTVTVPRVWPTGRINAEIALAPQARTIAGEVIAVPEARASLSTWAIPIPQLLTLLGAALLVVAVIGRRVRGRRRLAALLAAAREAGRREGLSAEAS